MSIIHASSYAVGYNLIQRVMWYLFMPMTVRPSTWEVSCDDCYPPTVVVYTAHIGLYDKVFELIHVSFVSSFLQVPLAVFVGMFIGSKVTAPLEPPPTHFARCTRNPIRPAYTHAPTIPHAP